MTIKLFTECDVLRLPPLPLEVGKDETHSYFATADETVEAVAENETWSVCWFDGRLYRARSVRLWEMTKR